MKIKKNTIFAVTFMIMAMISCDIDRVPETSTSDATYWNNETDLKLGVNYLYTLFPNLNTVLLRENWSDNASNMGATDPISSGSLAIPANEVDYTNDYKIIRYANNILEKAPGVVAKGTSQSIVNYYVGEALFFRAWAYYQLLQRYGGVPLILHAILAADSPELYSTQATRDQITEAIYADLDSAVGMLRTASQLGTANYGRISQTAAYALKAQVGLFEGTRAKFHKYGDPTKHLTIAKAAAQSVMNSGQHSLLANYFNLLQYAGEGFANKENILVKEYGNSLADPQAFHTAPNICQASNISPTKSLADSYLMTNGLPINSTTFYASLSNSNQVTVDRDPRMGARFFKAGDPYISTLPIFTLPNVSGTQITGFGNRCYQNSADWGATKSFIDHPMIRYAEILLIYAEATYELSDNISDADLNLSINLLRNRVGMPALTNGFVSANGLNMRDEIRRERRVELALEGSRYWDLIRWKTAEVELPKDMLGNYKFPELGYNPSNLDANGFNIIQKNRTFDVAKNYLWPFPTTELGLNPKLKQNPGW